MKQTIEPTLEYKIKANKCTTVSMLLACKGYKTYASMNQLSAYITVHVNDIRTMWEVINELKPFKHLEKSREFDNFKREDGSRFYTISIYY